MRFPNVALKKRCVTSIIGWVKSHEQLPPVHPKNVTMSKRAGDWYIAFKIDFEPQVTPKIRERMGVDVGIKRPP
jgi:putative transposase